MVLLLHRRDYLHIRYVALTIRLSRGVKLGALSLYRDPELMLWYDGGRLNKEKVCFYT